jgi:(p)ppGpp synthase/HD superfamily hydrolase
MNAETNMLLRAMHFATARHGTQKRKGTGLPYVLHVQNVAMLLAKAGVSDATVVAAALLHDVVEDTPTTIEEVRKEFGDAVADVVAQVTDDRSLSKAERKRAQIAHAPTMTVQAKLVKLADKLDNLSDLLAAPAAVGWSKERVLGYFAWSHAVVAGLRGTNSIIEAQLDRVFAAELLWTDGTNANTNTITMTSTPVLPAPSELQARLEAYLADMVASTD